VTWRFSFGEHRIIGLINPFDLVYCEGKQPKCIRGFQMPKKDPSPQDELQFDDSPSPEWSIRSKIWIEDRKGKVLFGAGRLRILEAVSHHGSILGAAKELHMSYRAVWGKIKATEKRLGRPLLTRKVGGARGGGSELTPLGKALIEKFQRLQILTEESTQELFKEFMAEFSSNDQGSS
jgi:molybdate transport system regulatory protein